MCRRALIVIALVLAPVRAVADESDADVFARVFDRAASDSAPVALIVDGASRGSLVVELRGGQPDAVSANAILPELSALRGAVRDRLANAAKAGKLALADLRAAGLDVVYDASRLELHIRIAATERERASHSLMPGMPVEAATAVQPSDISGHVNFYAHGGNASPQYLRAESATNVNGWVLEARGQLGASGDLQRGDVLLSRDDPARAVRYLAGDFAVSVGGLQLGYPLLGIGMTRNFALQPYRVIQPVSVFHFTLDRPAQVTVFVNGAAVQTLGLSAGRHDIRDLPLGAGVNDIELVVHDQAGERRIRFSATSPHELLAPGVTQFSLGFGFPLTSDIGPRDYAWHRPITTGRRRWGMTDRLTLAGAFDADQDRQVIGAGFAVATRLGNLAVDASGSHDHVAGVGHAESVRYDYQQTRRGAATTTLTVAARRYSQAFRGLAVLELDGRYRGDVSLATSHRLGARLFARTQLRYQAGRDATDAYDGAITLSRTFGGLAVDTLFGIRASEGEPRDLRVFVTARWQLPDRGGMLHAASRTSSRSGISNDLNFTTLPAPPPGGVVAAASLHESRDAYGTEVSLSHLHERFTSSITGAMNLDRVTGAARTTASFDVATALAFAGGRVAWSRPITGSFAIIDRNDVVADQLVGVDPVEGSYRARADRFGPAVVPSLEPYRVGTVRVEAPELPIGLSLGPARYALLPTYKSGTLVVVGEPGTVFLRGRLLDGDGAPIAHAIAELVAVRGAACQRSKFDNALQSDIDCVSERPQTTDIITRVVITNRAGRFSVIGMTPGRYEIVLASKLRIPVEIPATAAGIHDAGTLIAR